MPKASKRAIKLSVTATPSANAAGPAATTPAHKANSVPAANVAPVAAVAKPVKPVKASPVASVPNPDASAIRLAKAFCVKASKPSVGRTPNSESPRDTDYVNLVCVTAKRNKTTSPRVLDVAKIFLATPSLIAAKSHPALDLDVLNNRLIHHGFIERVKHADDIERACFTLTAKALASGIYARAS